MEYLKYWFKKIGADINMNNFINISGKGNKSKNEQVGLYQAAKLLYSKEHHQ